MNGPADPGNPKKGLPPRIGTSGWNYPTGKGTWNGIFYPLPEDRQRGFDEQSFYATRHRLRRPLGGGNPFLGLPATIASKVSSLEPR